MIILFFRKLFIFLLTEFIMMAHRQLHMFFGVVMLVIFVTSLFLLFSPSPGGKAARSEPGGFEPGGAVATSYVYAGSKLLMSKDPDGEKFYVKDHLGSASVVLSAYNQVVEEHQYWVFGEPRTEGEEKYRYTGKELDFDSGLYYYGARYYDSEIGRFTTADTVKGSMVNPQTLNRYSYVTNNPMKYVDPSGNQPNAADVTSVNIPPPPPEPEKPTLKVGPGVPKKKTEKKPKGKHDPIAFRINMGNPFTGEMPFLGALGGAATVYGDVAVDAIDLVASSADFTLGDGSSLSLGLAGVSLIIPGRVAKNFDQARVDAMKSSGLADVDPSTLQFAKTDPVTGTVVEFRGPDGGKVAYDTPHLGGEGPAHHDFSHVHGDAPDAKNTFIFEGAPHPGRTTKELHELFEVDPVKAHYRAANGGK
jgi:RHS repeat-associated protein